MRSMFITFLFFSSFCNFLSFIEVLSVKLIMCNRILNRYIRDFVRLICEIHMFVVVVVLQGDTLSMHLYSL